jgi:hypothetical protein
VGGDEWRTSWRGDDGAAPGWSLDSASLGRLWSRAVIHNEIGMESKMHQN